VIGPEHLKSFLIHEDRYLRRAAVEYFHQSWSPDGDLIPLVLESCRRWGEAETLPLLINSDRFQLTEQGLAQLLDYLAGASQELNIQHLNGILAAGPAKLLAAAEPAIRATANVRPETLERLHCRVALHSKSADDLWRELQDIAVHFEDIDNEVEIEYVDDLIDSLTPHAIPDPATICQLLTALAPGPTWLADFLVDLAGHRRIRQVLPLLVDFLETECDFLEERSAESLVKMGDPEAVQIIHARFEQWPWHAQLFAAEVLQDIKIPDAEEAVLDLLSRTKKLDIRTLLCWALCNQFSEKGIEVVRRQIRSGYDSTMVDLSDELLPVLDVLGVTLSEADSWRKMRARRDQRHKESEARFSQWSRKDTSFKKPVQAPLSLEPRNRSQLTADPKRIRVGRNDPCPCGSGQKFKRCCGALSRKK
jgi:hypothetical protein